MMSVAFEEVDGVEIVTGFDTAALDPVASAVALLAEMDGTPEAKVIISLAPIIQEKVGSRTRAVVFRVEAERCGNRVEAALQQAIADELSAEIQTLRARCAIAAAQLNRRRAEMKERTTVYSQRPGERLVDDSTAGELFDKLVSLKPGQRLTVDGRVIAGGGPR